MFHRRGHAFRAAISVITAGWRKQARSLRKRWPNDETCNTMRGLGGIPQTDEHMCAFVAGGVGGRVMGQPERRRGVGQERRES